MIPIPPDILRRIAALPKAVVADVLSIFADLIADFEISQPVSKESQKSQNETLKARNAHTLTSLTILPIGEVGTEEDKALIGKPSTRMPRAREGFDEFWDITAAIAPESTPPLSINAMGRSLIICRTTARSNVS